MKINKFRNILSSIKTARTKVEGFGEAGNKAAHCVHANGKERVGFVLLLPIDNGTELLLEAHGRNHCMTIDRKEERKWKQTKS